MTNEELDNANDVWRKATLDFKTMRRTLSVMSSLLGYNSGVGADRVARLEKTYPARNLKEGLEKLSGDGLAYLETKAMINKEQASAAFRTMLISNVTLPIAVITILLELANDAVLEQIGTTFGSGLYLILFIAIALGIIVVSYAYAASANAQDMYHLTILYSKELVDNDEPVQLQE